MSETRWVQGEVVKIDKTEGGLPKIALKVAKGYRIVVLQIGSVIPDIKSDFKQGNFIEGASLNDTKTYYEQPVAMKGDKHLVPGEHKASDDFCEGDSSQVEVSISDKNEVVDLLVLSLDQRVRVACAAARACSVEGEDFDSWVDQITTSIRNMNKVAK